MSQAPEKKDKSVKSVDTNAQMPDVRSGLPTRLLIRGAAVGTGLIVGGVTTAIVGPVIGVPAGVLATGYIIDKANQVGL